MSLNRRDTSHDHAVATRADAAASGTFDVHGTIASLARPPSCPEAASARISSVTRRLRARPSEESLDSTGRLSAKLMAVSRPAATPLAMNKRTTALARALASSQLDGYCGVPIGTLSVWPSTCT